MEYKTINANLQGNEKLNFHTVAQQKNHTPDSKLPPYINFDGGMYVTTLITFLILLFILGKYGFPKIINIIDEREKTIGDNLQKAKDLDIATQKNQEEKAKILREAKHEAEAIIKKGKETAEKIAVTIEDQAKNRSSQMVLSAKEEIEYEKEKTAKLLKLELADLSI